MKNLLRWYHTVRPLKAAQWWYRAWRPLAQRLSSRRKVTEGDLGAAKGWPAIPLQSLQVGRSYFPAERKFCFLNRCKTFPQGIAWDWRGEGLLWTYNLNYFEWLYDDALSVEDRRETIEAFAAAKSAERLADDAYPASLRIMAWIRFLLRFGVKGEAILKRLFGDAEWLYRFPEYQLDGNHLWENAVAILCAGAYFRKERFSEKGSRLLCRCIREQVMADGGHAEGSPMYHSLLLWRLMQCLELFRALGAADGGLESLIAETSSRMLGWLQAMTFSDGSWPQFNDCATGIAPDTAELTGFAAALGIISSQKTQLHESGYRMLRWGDFELAVDVAAIQPAWQPGHAHADAGTFCLHYKGRPMIVDTGTSTYEPGARRQWERETAAHNTVVIGGKPSSELWKAFRVGRRARVLEVVEGAQLLSIAYTPYAYPAAVHRRVFTWNADRLNIRDEVSDGPVHNTARLHFCPGIDLSPRGDDQIKAAGLIFQAEGAGWCRFEEGLIAQGFNALSPAITAGFSFQARLTVSIVIDASG